MGLNHRLMGVAALKSGKKRFPIFEIVLLVLVFSLHFPILFSSPDAVLHYISEDESFYAFQIARNLVEGHGLTFDRVNPTNSIAPLWLVVLSPFFLLARFDLFLPLRMLVILSALLNAGAAILLYRLMRRMLSDSISMLAAAAWALLPNILKVTVQSGMESSLNAFLLAGFLLLAVKAAEKSCDQLTTREVLRLGGAAAALLLTRYDNLILVLVFGVWLVFRGSRMRYMVLVDAMLIFISVFGSFLLRFDLNTFYQFTRPAQWVLSLSLLIKPVVMYFSGMYFPPRTWPRWKTLGLTYGGMSFASLLIAGLLELAERLGWLPGFPRTVLVLDWLISLTLLGGLRFTLRLMARLRGFKPDGVEPTLRLQHQWKTWLRVWLAFLAPGAAALGAVLVWNWVNFQRVLPLNLLVKRWWTGHVTVYGRPPEIFVEAIGLSATPGEPWSFILTPMLDRLSRMVTTVLRVDDLELYQLMVVLFAVGFLAMAYQLARVGRNRGFLTIIDRGLAFLPLMTACFMTIGYYKLVGYVEMRPWYWIPEMMLTLLAMAFLTHRLIELAVEKAVPKALVEILGSVVAVSLLVAGISEQMELFSRKSFPDNPLLALESLEAETQQGDLIACVEAGKLAYLSTDRLIINLDGTVSSYKYFDLMKAQRSNEFFEHIGLDYVYGDRVAITLSEPYQYMFEDHLEKQEDIAGQTLFRYLP
ncbi:hypothetical protein ADN00_10970 [Ornatilinea apprima]|uniref:Glycosyltransferase RgtA/B/C/D-like domain-containing protein n=1 Tax=Ornatilinea apprima TaxID=1134406 RepID=A0A0P6XMP3_9CHLR|nr:hypothetical protein [Ornatilinea apprima]KPL76489.1 hypothetical protein ADN00_10970 [Ornatilinea apprima]